MRAEKKTGSRGVIYASAVRRWPLTRFAAGFALGASLLSSGSALADERTEARAHFKKGMANVADGRYEAGIEELKKAYDILPHPNVLFNIARAYVDMGDLENAVAFYKRYLEGNPKDRDEVAQIVASLEARARKQQAQLLEAQQAQGGPAPPAAGGIPAPGGPGPAPGKPAGVQGPAPGAAGAAPAGPGLAPGAGVVAAEGLKTEEVFEETVVTASKTAQSPLDAPNSTSIVTEQDVRLSGITKIPELLRRLAGVDILEDTGGQTEVSLRGFNQRLSNKVLVLVNGRSVFVDLLGATIWSTLSIGVEDIERIEVVRGPGSALYGADAFNGVINIITKTPGEGKSGVSAGYGDRNAAHGTVWSTGRDRELSYRVSAGYDYLPRWSREVPRGRADLHLATSDQDASLRGSRLDGTVTRQFGKDVTVGVQGGYVTGSSEILGIGPVNDVVIQPFTATDLTAFANSEHVEARVFWNRFSGLNSNNAAYLGQSLLPARFSVDVVDAEVQYIDRFTTGQGIVHDLHVGAGYRFKGVQWTYEDTDRTENHFAGYLHDEVKIGERFALVGDYRLDFVPYYSTSGSSISPLVQSPRGSILFHPSKRSTVRGSVGTAFRTPTFLESYLGIPIQLPIAGAALISEGVRSGQPSFRLQPEKILTTEIGYLNSESDFFTFDSAAFYNRVNNLIELSTNRPVTVGDLAAANEPTGPNPSTGFYPAFFGGFESQCQAYNVFGGEVGVRTSPVEGLDVYGNYTVMSVKQDRSGCTEEQRALLAFDARTSAHKASGGVQLRTPFGVDAEIDVHYVSPQDWAEQVVNLQLQRIEYQTFHLDAYALVNARIGYRFLRNQAEASAAAFNLLGNEHREHPFGQVIGRRTMGFFTYRF